MMNTGDGGIGRRTVLRGAAGLGGAALAPAWMMRSAHGSARGSVDARAVDAAAALLAHDLVELRRDLHRHPELSGQEARTADVVARRLRAAGLAVTTGVGGHGVVGRLTGARPGRTVAYRADMDAVPLGGQVGGGSAAAHVCGHDVHTTIGVGVAAVLARLRSRLAGTVVFIFQPAEETLTGAAAMLDAGVFARFRPAEIHALHCSQFPVGRFLVTPGFGLPGQDHGTVTVTGTDARVRAERLAADIGRLGTVAVPTTSAELERFVTDVQTPNGPYAEFVSMSARVPDADGPVEIRLSYRCWPEERYLKVRQDVRRLARACGGASVAFPKDPFPAMLCPEPEGHALARYLARTMGRDRVGMMHAALPFSGEDFAVFLNQVPGTYTFLGVRTPEADIRTSFPHFREFVPDERAIGLGVRAMAGWLSSRTLFTAAHRDE